MEKSVINTPGGKDYIIYLLSITKNVFHYQSTKRKKYYNGLLKITNSSGVNQYKKVVGVQNDHQPKTSERLADENKKARH